MRSLSAIPARTLTEIRARGRSRAAAARDAARAASPALKLPRDRAVPGEIKNLTGAAAEQLAERGLAPAALAAAAIVPFDGPQPERVLAPWRLRLGRRAEASSAGPLDLGV